MRLNCFILLSIISACQSTDSDSTYFNELENWRSERLAQLNAEDGWLSLVGLYRLNKEEHLLGSDAENDVVLPEDFPAHFGQLNITQDQILLNTEVPVTVAGKPVSEFNLIPTGQSIARTLVSFENYQFLIIKRGSTYLMRLRDLGRADQHSLSEIAHFEPDEKWAVEAQLEEKGRGDTMVVKNIIGLDVTYISEGTLTFELAGKTYGLAAFGGTDTYFVMLSDETTGDETYGGGRYLYVPKVDENNRTVVDFNQAQNPPCVFTEFATCPLPPRENHLALHLRAGEKMMEH